MSHLWEHAHPYYASEGCFYTSGLDWHEVHQEWATWADYAAAWADADMDYNLLYRWDWVRPDPDDYPEDDAPTTDELRLYFMLQRKAKPCSHYVAVTEADEVDVRAWLTTRAEHLRRVWEPLLDGIAS